MMNKINVALQVLPVSSKKDSYDLVDIAIAEIEKSGLKYKVCPFETVIEGTFDEIMPLVGRIHELLYASGAEKMMCYIKIQSSNNQDVLIEDKMHKYE
ncbi:MAG TPA: hypothetical protein DD458_13835 [Prolixibacteraceae bacterium]|nr:hypothetical protein [Prolixibacteraceae bacterium]HCR92215.1 hypothetical protein [Prolixibacteraceae bacterium]HCU60538.1 hypothetical protein [Prolixibacteraceae bacterium]